LPDWIPGQYRKSIDYFKTAIKLDSTETDLYPLMAESYMKVKSYHSTTIPQYKKISHQSNIHFLTGDLPTPDDNADSDPTN